MYIQPEWVMTITEAPIFDIPSYVNYEYVEDEYDETW